MPRPSQVLSGEDSHHKAAHAESGPTAPRRTNGLFSPHPLPSLSHSS